MADASLPATAAFKDLAIEHADGRILLALPPKIYVDLLHVLVALLCVALDRYPGTLASDESKLQALENDTQSSSSPALIGILRLRVLERRILSKLYQIVLVQIDEIGTTS